MKLITSENANLLFEARVAVDHPTDLEKVRNEVKKYATREDRAAYVVCDGDVAVGYVECKLGDDLPAEAPAIEGLQNIGYVARIGVRKEYRSKGIGKQLLNQAERWLQAEGKSGACLGYHSKNPPAGILYSHSGYQNVAVFKDGGKDRMRIIAVKRW